MGSLGTDLLFEPATLASFISPGGCWFVFNWANVFYCSKINFIYLKRLHIEFSVGFAWVSQPCWAMMTQFSSTAMLLLSCRALSLSTAAQLICVLAGHQRRRALLLCFHVSIFLFVLSDFSFILLFSDCLSCISSLLMYCWSKPNFKSCISFASLQ